MFKSRNCHNNTQPTQAEFNHSQENTIGLEGIKTIIPWQELLSRVEDSAIELGAMIAEQIDQTTSPVNQQIEIASGAALTPVAVEVANYIANKTNLDSNLKVNAEQLTKEIINEFVPTVTVATHALIAANSDKPSRQNLEQLDNPST
jgi:hypothetical protein